MSPVSASPSGPRVRPFHPPIPGLQLPLRDGRFDAGAASGFKPIVQGKTGASTPALGMETWKNLQLGPARGSTFFHATAHGGVGSKKRRLGKAASLSGEDPIFRVGTGCISSTESSQI